MLVLAIHSLVSEVSAKVAFSTILLQDFITNKKVPPEFKCRMLVPTSGKRSCSLWDVQDPDALLAWLKECVGVDCEHEVYECQEDFGMGLGEITRQRAADRVATGTNQVAKAIEGAAAATAQTVQGIDTRLRITDRATHAVEAVKESTVVQSTAAAFGKAGASVLTASKKVMDQPAVAQATEAVGTGIRKFTTSLSSLAGPRKDSSGGGNSLSPLGEGAVRTP
jgi:hypothetical protein